MSVFLLRFIAVPFMVWAPIHQLLPCLASVKISHNSTHLPDCIFFLQEHPRIRLENNSEC